MEDEKFRGDVMGQDKDRLPEQCDYNNAIGNNHGKYNEGRKFDNTCNDESRDVNNGGAEEVGINDTSNNPQGDTDNTKDKTVLEGQYQELPSNLLHCSVCNKSMWNVDSFQMHVGGKAHRQIMRSVERGFHINDKFLRMHASLLEVNKMIELERKNRIFENYRGLNQEETTHCNMCDGTFLGTGITHRATKEHRHLKRFLHPKCNYCLQKFSSRLEWVDHLFTIDHLEKVKEVMNTNASKENEAPIIEEAAEMNIDLLLEKTLKPEAENPILELGENLKNLHRRLPLYNPTRKIAKENVKPMSGIYCNLCKLFFTKETLANDHLLTKKHYRAFVKHMKREFKKRNDKEKEIKKDQNNSEEACQINVTSSDNISDNEKFALTYGNEVKGEAEDKEIPYQEEDALLGEL